MLWFFILWWTFDDTLAASLNAPNLGELDWWVVLLFSIAIANTNTVRLEKNTNHA